MIVACARPKDWVVLRFYDRGPAWFYRYHVEGINLNWSEDDPQRCFSWNVPDLDPRFDMSEAQPMPRPELDPTR